MAIIGRLHILETLSRGRIESYRVRDPVDNVTRLLHYGDALLFDIADDLGDDVIEWGDAGNKQYIVTRDTPEYEDLNHRPPIFSGSKEKLGKAGQWPVARSKLEEVQQPVMKNDDSPESKDQPGEFTRLFKAVPAPPAPQQDAAKDPEPQTGEFTRMFTATPATGPVKPPQRPERASNFRPPEANREPGEFTRMFRPPAPAQTEAPVVTPRPEPPAAAPKSGPGDFTRMFSASPPPHEPAPAPPAPAVSSPGQDSEFTRFFKDPLPSTGREVNWKAIENQAPPPPAPKGPGEFTRMFGRPQTRGKGQVPEGGATDLFQSSKPTANSPAQVDDFAKMFAQSPAANEARPAASIQVQAAPPAPAPARPAGAAVNKPAGPPVLVLVVIIAAVLVLAGCALYYFVFKK